MTMSKSRGFIVENEENRSTNTRSARAQRLKLISVGLSTAALCMASGEALAQNDQSTGSEQQADSSSENVIVVTGVRAGLIRATEQKRAAVGVVDAISAEDIGKFPDLNLSESLQRVPGVTLNRGNGGEGQAINLRGLGPDFTRVEINGLTAPSNGTTDVFGGSGGGRGFNFEILPSELFTNAAVYKTARASDSEGGLAGIVRLETAKPLDYNGFKFTASAQGDYSENAESLGGRAAVFVSNNFNDVFGVAASVVYSKSQFQTNRSGGFNVRPLAIILTKAAAALATPTQLAAQVTNIEHYIHDTQDRETISANGAIQIRPSDTLELTFTGLYSHLDAERVFTRFDAPSEGNVTGFSNLVVENGLVTSGTFSGVQQRIGINDNSSVENLYQFTAAADWKPDDNWTITPSLGYTKRDVERVGNLLSMRRADLSTGNFVNADVSYTYRGDFVDWTTSGTNFSANPEEFLLNVFLLRPSTDQDSDFQSKLDFERTFDDSPLKSIDFGMRYSSRDIARTGADTRVVANTGFDRRMLPSVADALVTLNNFNIDGAPSSVPNTLISANPTQLLNLYLPGGVNAAPVTGASVAPRPLVTAQRSFDVQEKTFNAYAEATFEIDTFTLNTGVRFLRTKQTSGGSQIVNGVPSPISFTNNYTAFLPSMSARYEVADNVLLRASYSRSLTRPGLGALAPTETVNGVDEGGGTGTQGNPNLEPFTSDNIDFGAEYYFGGEGYIALNFFYKQLDGIIDTESFTENRTFPRQADNVIVTAPIVFTRPANGASATIRGFEIAGQLPFNAFTDAAFISDSGVFANYTYANSNADFSSATDVRSSGLPGLSQDSVNVALYFDNGTLDARLAYAWRGDFLQAFSGAFGVPRFQKPFGQLDFSANLKLLENLNVQFQALNITKEQTIFTTSELRAPNAVTQNDRRFLFGVRYSF